MRPAPSYRPLCAKADRDLVTGFYRRAADYILLETGVPPSEATTEAYFSGAPEGHDGSGDLREGLFVGARLDGIAELAFALPRQDCATLTLMILAPEARGCGLGAAWAERLCQIAGARGARRLCLSVLRSNPRGLAFWQRSGFSRTAWTMVEGRYQLAKTLG